MVWIELIVSPKKNQNCKFDLLLDLLGFIDLFLIIKNEFMKENIIGKDIHKK